VKIELAEELSGEKRGRKEGRCEERLGGRNPERYLFISINKYLSGFSIAHRDDYLPKKRSGR
jgi:hypothetical protein